MKIKSLHFSSCTVFDIDIGGRLIGLKQCECGWKQMHINDRIWGSQNCQDIKMGTWEKQACYHSYERFTQSTYGSFILWTYDQLQYNIPF